MDEVEKVAGQVMHQGACQTDEFVIIDVEDGGLSFKVLKSTLCDTSEYFVAALKGDWIEATERRLRLSGTDIETAKLFVYWLQKQTLPSFVDDIQHGAAVAHIDRLLLLARLWILGDQILSPTLQNEAMSDILDVIHKRTTPFGAICECCQIAPKGSKLAKVFIADLKHEVFSVGHISGAEFEKVAGNPGVMEEFVHDVNKCLSDHGELTRSVDFASAGSIDDEENHQVDEKPR